jgi:6-phosphofructokinase 2
LEVEGVTCRPVPIAGNTRQDFTADETSTGKQYRFVLEGPELSEPEWSSCLDALAKEIVPDAYVVASGSLPPGVPDNFYGRVARLVNQRGARCVIDASGAALQAALDEG